jgi:hypothetical protein
VLRPGGRLVLALHEGDETRRPGEMWDIPVGLEFNFFTYNHLTRALLEARFTIEQITHRSPYPRSKSRPTASTPPPLPPSRKGAANR